VHYTFLSGGTGTPKLLEGFRKIIDDSKLVVIANNGDDYYWNSLLVSPDLDTLLYMFSHKLDLDKYWGRSKETSNVLNELRNWNLDENEMNTWFFIGDKDLSLHVYRNHLLQNGLSLNEITSKFREMWNINSLIIPMSDDFVQTQIITKNKTLHFQEYFVKHQTNVDVKDVEFFGCNKAKALPEAIKGLQDSKYNIIGPSNPITSIGPILSLNDYKEVLTETRSKNILVSPIKGGNAFSGPTSKLMKALKVSSDLKGLASIYKNYVSKFIIDPVDRATSGILADYNIEPIFLDIQINTIEEKQRLAEHILEII
jgi:LPPG:FO 2-phospho-L-lactate transferase